MKYKNQGNVDKGHFEPMEDTKREPYKTKGYIQNTRRQKLKQTQIYIYKYIYNNISMMVGSIVARMQV
jgi:hypothetical protein